MARDEFFDPTGARYGIPTYPWHLAPEDLATRRQLLADELRPGEPEPVAQILWHHGPAIRVAYLWRIDRAKPKRIPPLAQLGALQKALIARQTCRGCGTDAGYRLPARWEGCPACNPANTILTA